jgi:FkbM family methyltransferase
MARTSLVNYLPVSVITGPKLVVDVGAYVGEWSEGVLELLRPERLISIEPSPTNFAALERRLGGRPGVELLPLAPGLATDEPRSTSAQRATSTRCS